MFIVFIIIVCFCVFLYRKNKNGTLNVCSIPENGLFKRLFTLPIIQVFASLLALLYSKSAIYMCTYKATDDVRKSLESNWGIFGSWGADAIDEFLYSGIGQILSPATFICNFTQILLGLIVIFIIAQFYYIKKKKYSANVFVIISIAISTCVLYCMWNAVYCLEWATSYHVNALSFGLLGKDDISEKATELTITIFAILAVTHYFYHRWIHFYYGITPKENEASTANRQLSNNESKTINETVVPIPNPANLNTEKQAHSQDRLDSSALMENNSSQEKSGTSDSTYSNEENNSYNKNINAKEYQKESTDDFSKYKYYIIAGIVTVLVIGFYYTLNPYTNENADVVENVKDTVIAENANNTEIEDEAENTENETAPSRDTFVTPDLAFYDVVGHVKIIYEHSWRETTHKYTYDGELIGEIVSVGEGWDVNWYERDDQGRIHTNANGHYTYIFNKEGTQLDGYHYAHMGLGENVRYLYDENRFRIGEEVDSLDEDYEKVVKTKKIIYTDVEYDSHGNWTSKVVDGKKEVREIEYYE